MPAEQRVGRDDRRDVAQQATAQPVGQRRESPPIGIGETQSPFTRLPPEQAIRFDQIGEHLPFPAIQPGRNGNEQQLECRDVDHGRELTSPPKHSGSTHIDRAVGHFALSARPAGRVFRGPLESNDHFDPSSVSGCLGKRTVAGDDRRLNRFGEGDVHCVVCADVVSQLPRTIQKIEVGVTMEIEVSEICNHILGTVGGDFTGPHETSKTLSYLDVQEVWRVQLVLLAEEAGLDSRTKRGLEKKFQQSRRVDDNHADSRPSRITTAAGVFRVTRLRRWSRANISWRVGRAASRSSSARR
jgi:hypothetical protein